MTTASLQPAVLAFTMALAIVTGLVFGLVPALVVFRGNTWSLLKDDSTRGSAGRSTGLTRSALVVAETAFALVLLVGGRLAAQELPAAAECRSGIRDRPRADGADFAARGALSRPRGAPCLLAPPAGGRSRSAGRHISGSDDQCAVQRERLVGVVFDRRLYAGADRIRAARPAGGCRRRLLHGHADSARRGPFLQRRGHGRQPARRRHRPVPRQQVFREG